MLPIVTIRHLAAIMLSLLLATTVFGQTKPLGTDEATKREITQMLLTFLSPAENNTVAAHAVFWADDLVYTSAIGVVRSKAEILKLVGEQQKSRPAAAEPEQTFTTEDILVRPYGNMAALTARLISHEPNGEAANYRLSGTFLKRHGKWQVVTWQATKESPPPAPSK